MQILASLKRQAISSDIKNAFGQSMKTTRQQPIAASLPQGMAEAGYDLDPRQLLLCETEVYGLISGPSWLRQSLVNNLEGLGYVKNPYDKCMMMLPPDKKPIDTRKNATNTQPGSANSCYLNDGIVLIEVDDILEGGNDRHRNLMKSFYTKYQCCLLYTSPSPRDS